MIVVVNFIRKVFIMYGVISGVDIWNEFVIDFFGVFWMIVKNLVLLVVFFIVDFDFLLFLLGMD